MLYGASIYSHIYSILLVDCLQNGIVPDHQTQELLKRPHVQAVLADGYKQEQVEEVFNRFGKFTSSNRNSAWIVYREW